MKQRKNFFSREFFGSSRLLVAGGIIILSFQNCAPGKFSETVYNSVPAQLSPAGSSNPNAPQCLFKDVEYINANATLTTDANTPFTLSVSCTSNSTKPLIYEWTLANPGSAVLPNQSSSLSIPNGVPIDTTYFVVAHNDSGYSESISVLVKVVATSPSPPPVAYTIPKDCRIVDITWRAGLDIRGYPWSNPKQFLLNGQLVAYRMKVTDTMNQLTSARTAYNSVEKQMSISANPCDFSPVLANNHCMTTGNEPVLPYTGGTSSGSACQLPPVDSYVYFNLKNVGLTASSEQNFSCPEGWDCSFYFMW